LSGSAFAEEPALRGSLLEPISMISPYPQISKTQKKIVSLTYTEFPKFRMRFATKVKVIRSDHESSSLTFGSYYYKNRKYEYDYIPRSADAETFSSYRRRQLLSHNLSEMNSKALSKLQKDKRGGLLQVNIPIKSKVMESIAGEGGVGLKLSGSHRIVFSGRSQWDNLSHDNYSQSKFPSLQMEQVSQFTINGTIGSKISVSVSQNSKVSTPLANRLIIRYKGDEDDVIKSIEAGNTTLSLPNTQFVGYSSRIKGLFGLKAEAQVGGLKITAIASQEKGTTERTTIESGSSVGKTTILRDYQYDSGRLFDLGMIGDSVDLKEGDKIVYLTVYKSYVPREGEYNPNDSATIYVDPNNTSDTSAINDNKTDGYVEEITDTDTYILQETDHTLMFKTPSSHRGKDIGVYIQLVILKAPN